MVDSDADTQNVPMMQEVLQSKTAISSTLSPIDVEVEIPDPFLIDDGEDEDEDDDTPPISPSYDSHKSSIPPSDEISPSTSSRHVLLASADVNKAIPPPSAISDEEEEEIPKIVAPGIVAPTMFLPIPNVRPPSQCPKCSGGWDQCANGQIDRPAYSSSYEIRFPSRGPSSP